MIEAVRLPRRVTAPIEVPGGLVLVLVAAVYFAVAKLGLTFAAGDDIVSAVWPPSGVALAAVVVLGRRVWPAIFLGAFVANATAAPRAPGRTGAGLTVRQRPQERVRPRRRPRRRRGGAG